MATTAREIDYTTAQPDGPPEITFPFEQKGDPSTVVVVQRYKQSRAGFIADRLARRWIPGVTVHPDFDSSYTNLIPYSNDFGNAAWTKYRITPTSNVIANPWDGTTTVDQLLETTHTGAHGIEQQITYAATPTTLWAIVKGGLGRTWVRLQAVDSGVSFYRGWVNLDTGAAGSATGTGCTVATPISLGGGFWLISISFTPEAGAGDADLFLADGDASTATYAGDVTKGIYIAQMQAESASTYGPVIITTTAARTVDLSAYLQTTSEPEVTPTALYRFSRTFSSVPETHYDPASRLFERPVMHDILSGSNYAVSFSPDGSWVFASRKTVSAIAAPAISYTNPDNELATIGAQSVTIELNSGAETFALNASDTTIKEALSTACTGGTGNAANFFVSRWTYGVYFSWTGISVTIKGITTSSTEITVGDRTVAVGPASSTGPIEFLAAGTNRTSTRTVTSAGHGFSAGNRVALYNGDKIVAMSKVVSATTDTFTINTADLPDADAVVTACVADKDGTRYVNGAIDCSARIATRFYLPGVTSGITTMADIPNFTPTIDPVNWLAQVVAYATSPSVSAYAVIETSALERWLDGPTLVKRVTELQLADALVTASATA